MFDSPLLEMTSHVFGRLVEMTDRGKHLRGIVFTTILG